MFPNGKIEWEKSKFSENAPAWVLSPQKASGRTSGEHGSFTAMPRIKATDRKHVEKSPAVACHRRNQEAQNTQQRPFLWHRGAF